MNIEKNKILAPFCTYLIGGPADFFLDAKTKEDLAEALKWAAENKLRTFVFGGGSNLLFADEGFRGLVIKVSMNEVRALDEKIIADAGVKIFTLVKTAQDAGLSGLESWNGLPGTVGGAVFGNAGCFGTETKDILESAEIFIPGEGIASKNADYFDYVYRNSKVKKNPGVIILNATFKLKKDDVQKIKERMNEIARLRITKQPAGSSTGSFFKNPPGELSAGSLIDQCGLKGKMLGKAQISEQHANFFLNKGGAKATDIIELGEAAKNAVREKFGVELEREVVFVAEK